MIPTGPDISSVRSFWEAHPVAAAAITAEPGTRAFYAQFEILRERIEPTSFQGSFYEYERYAGKRVLDVGCGNGYLLSRFARAGARATGLDLTARAVDLSRRRFALEGLNGSFSQGNAEALPFGDDTFDLILSMGVLHHTPRTETSVSEILRVLKPDGAFLMMVYHRNSLVYRFALALGRHVHPALRRRSMEELVNRLDGETNPLGKVYSRSEVERLLSGFDDVTVFPRCLEPSHFGRRWVGELVPERVRDRLAQYWGWFLYARARKPR